MALVAVQSQRAKVLGTFAPGAEPAVLANAELKFWATILTQLEEDVLATMLHFHGSGSLAQATQGGLQASRFDLYQLDVAAQYPLVHW